MTAFYLTSTSQDVLLSMLTDMYANVLGPSPAIPAVPAGFDIDNNPTPAIPAKGIVGNYYMSIDIPGVDTFPTALPNGVTEDDVNGVAVLGVWA